MKSTVVVAFLLGVFLLHAGHVTCGRNLQQQGGGGAAAAPQQSFLTLSQAFGNMSRPALLDFIEALLDPTDLADRQAFYQHLLANTTVDRGHLVYAPAHPVHSGRSNNTSSNSTSTHGGNSTAPAAASVPSVSVAATNTSVCKANGEVCYDPMGAFPNGPSLCCDPESACIVGGGGMHICTVVAK